MIRAAALYLRCAKHQRTQLHFVAEAAVGVRRIERQVPHLSDEQDRRVLAHALERHAKDRQRHAERRQGLFKAVCTSADTPAIRSAGVAG